MSVYLDNAATTPLDERVLEEMLPLMKDHFGNPSSIHAHGRKTRNAVENGRKKIAELLQTSPAQIFFTSGGTEADNTAIIGSIFSKELKHAITTPLEHHAVGHCLDYLEKKGNIQLHYVEVNEKGEINYQHLEELLQNHTPALVSLMHGNNEIANLLDLEKTGELVKHYKGTFHSDTVQTMGHYKHHAEKLPIDFMVASAHKLHGPKGIGFLYVGDGNNIPPYIHGGSQERNMRGGTENIYGIVGMAKAMELAYEEMDDHANHIKTLKAKVIKELKNAIPDIRFNGTSDDVENSLYTVLSLCLPEHEIGEMMLMNLDMHGISCSGGSACTSGSQVGSHVLNALNHDPNRPAIRVSFSRMNTMEEIDNFIEVMSNIYQPQST